ncbi:MAG: Hpt domain-containing protein [Alphaproteobacteria bacterium]
MTGEFEGRVFAKGAERIVEEMRQEFVDEATEFLQALDVALDATRHGRKPAAEVIADIHRVALTLRGQSVSMGFRLIGTVAHRLEDYLANARGELSPRATDDLQAFVDVMLEVISGRIPADADPSEVVRRLPAKLVSFNLAEIEVRNIEVMLVMLHGAQTHFVERELQQCGYRVSICSNTFDAVALAVRTKPDLIIVSAMMPELSGIDVAIALASMPSTRNIPTALITSLDADDEQLKLLPRKVPVIRKGPTFGDDLFKTLDSLFLI